jgi:hypothetical protein
VASEPGCGRDLQVASEPGRGRDLQVTSVPERAQDLQVTSGPVRDCWWVWRALPAAIRFFCEIVTLCKPPPHQDLGRARTAGNRYARDEKSRAPAGGSNYPENCLVKPQRRDTRAHSPAGMFGGKAPLRLAAQKSRFHAPSVPMRSAPAYFICKWGV